METYKEKELAKVRRGKLRGHQYKRCESIMINYRSSFKIFRMGNGVQSHLKVAACEYTSRNTLDNQSEKPRSQKKLK